MGFPIKRKKKEKQPAPEEYHPPQKEENNFPIPEKTYAPEEPDESTYLAEMIGKKKRTLDEERENLNKLRHEMEEHVKEIEALNFIRTGDPTITIADLLEILDDYRKNDAEKSAKELLDDIEKSLIKSTIDGM